jgi:hypothetical protein
VLCRWSPRGLNGDRSAKPVGGGGAAGPRVALYSRTWRQCCAGLLPVAALAWVVISGLGRSVCAEGGWIGQRAAGAFRPLGMMVLQAAWLAVWARWWGWFRSMEWVARRTFAAYGGRRAGPGGLFDLGDLSVAGVLYGVGAGELAAVDCAAADAA